MIRLLAVLQVVLMLGAASPHSAAAEEVSGGVQPVSPAPAFCSAEWLQANQNNPAAFVQAILNEAGRASVPAAFSGGVLRSGQSERLVIGHPFDPALRNFAVVEFAAGKDAAGSLICPDGTPPSILNGTAPKCLQKVAVLSVAAGEGADRNAQYMAVEIPEPGLWPLWTTLHWYVAACSSDGGPLIKDGRRQNFVAFASAPVSTRLTAMAAGIATVVFLYGLLCVAINQLRRRLGSDAWWKASNWKDWRIGPLSLTAGLTGRTSLANLQLLWFTLITAFIVAYTLVRTGSWAEIKLETLAPLGIVAASTVTSKFLTDWQMLSPVNMVWLKRVGWLSPQPRVWSLFTTRGEPDLARLQTVAFGLLIGLGMLIAAVNDYTGLGDPTTLLALLGGSQITYLVGKQVKPNVPGAGEIDVLNKAVDAARQAAVGLGPIMTQRAAGLTVASGDLDGASGHARAALAAVATEVSRPANIEEKIAILVPLLEGLEAACKANAAAAAKLTPDAGPADADAVERTIGDLTRGTAPIEAAIDGLLAALSPPPGGPAPVQIIADAEATLNDLKAKRIAWSAASGNPAGLQDYLSKAAAAANEVTKSLEEPLPDRAEWGLDLRPALNALTDS